MGLIHFGDKEHFCVPGEKRFDEAAIRVFCTDAGLAFYDTASEVRRLKDNASDAFLEVVTPTDIPALLARIPECRTLVTTGEKASQIVAQTFGCAVPPVGGHTVIPSEPSVIPSQPSVIPSEPPVIPSRPSVIPSVAKESITFWRMPSTSRAYPLKLEKKADEYWKLFRA